MYNGICENCQEELFIEEFQYEYLDTTSDDWKELVEQQRRKIAKSQHHED